MKILLVLIGLLLVELSCSAQTGKRALKVYSITEYIDGYVITAIDSSKGDTLNIVSAKEPKSKKIKLQRIEIGKKYIFKFKNRMADMASIPSDTFVLRIKTTIVWSRKDGLNNVPVFATNMRGLWVEKE